jgi:sugar lactone lactonase YvrE
VFFTDGPDLVRITPDGKTTRLARNLKVLSWWQFFVGDRHNVMGLWTDQEGNVYVAVYGGRLVKKVSPSGQMTAAARSSPPWSPTGGLVDPTGNLWLLEYSVTNAVRVRRIERNGRETVY